MEYRYVAKDYSGREVVGTMEASSPREVASALRSEGLILISVEPVKKGLTLNLEIPLFSRISLKDMSIAMRQLSAMVGAGISLPIALDAIASQTRNKRLREVLESLKNSVEAGMSFSEALKEHPKVFDSLFISMVEAGEATGELNVMLDRWIVMAEKVLALRRKVRNAMIYPVAVLVIALCILAFLLVKVVPTFTKIFRESGVELPALTQFVIGVSELVKHRFYLILACIVGFFVAFRLALRNEAFRYRWDGFKLRVPLFGNLTTKSAVARFSRTMATMLKSGVNILDGMDIVARTSGNLVIERSLVEARDRVARGELLSEVLKDNPLFPPLVIEMTAAGERTGELDGMLEKVAEFYEEEVDYAVEALTTMMEPLMLVVLGGMIGIIVIALYLPIFKLASTVR